MIFIICYAEAHAGVTDVNGMEKRGGRKANIAAECISDVNKINIPLQEYS
jgi:hypothetical protein